MLKNDPRWLARWSEGRAVYVRPGRFETTSPTYGELDFVDELRP